jgi:hypothetical protein
LALPAAVLVRPPIGDVETSRLGIVPAPACLRHRVRVVAIEQDHDALISGGVSRQRNAVDEETNVRAIRIGFVHRDQHRLRLRVAVAFGAVRQETVLAVRPQMRIERVDALLRSGLHHDVPAPLQGSFQQGRQHALQWMPLEMIEQHLRHERLARHS